ncbi:MAG: CsbD family protein [Paracoccaceae bacterium]
MNWDQIEGKWKQLKGSARAEWGELTDQELEETRGRREKLAGLIQEKYGRTREEVENALDRWSKAI